MNNDNRIIRLEDKIDLIKDEVSELKTEFIKQKSDIKLYLKKVEEHIVGDNKIINELKPVLSKLPDIMTMAEEYNEDKIVMKRVKAIKMNIIKVLAGLGTILGILVSLSKLGIINI